VRARRHIGVLVKQDLRYTFSSARGLLFLIFFGMFWGWVLSKLAGGLGEQLGTPQAGFLVTWLFDANVARLLQERPVTLAAYLVVAAMLTPLFAMLASCDQTATDLREKTLVLPPDLRAVFDPLGLNDAPRMSFGAPAPEPIRAVSFASELRREPSAHPVAQSSALPSPSPSLPE